MFDIQMFGTNDTVTSAIELAVANAFTDGDTRTFRLKNPREDLTAEDIEAVSNFIIIGNLLIGDKNGADFAGIDSATKVDTTKTKLDIS